MQTVGILQGRRLVRRVDINGVASWGRQMFDGGRETTQVYRPMGGGGGTRVFLRASSALSDPSPLWRFSWSLAGASGGFMGGLEVIGALNGFRAHCGTFRARM